MFLRYQIGNKSFSQQGFAIVEALIASTIIIVALTSIVGLVTLSLVVSSITKQTTHATLFAQDTMEALRNFKDGVDWNNNDLADEYDGLGVIPPDDTYHLEKSTDSPPRWKVISGEKVVDVFTIKLFFSGVFRDDDDDIAVAGTPDSDTKEVVVRVSWTERGRSHEVVLVTYLTNWNQ